LNRTVVKHRLALRSGDVVCRALIIVSLILAAAIARGVQKLDSRSESRLGTDIDSFGLP
jgi:hypothetical protein